MWTILKNWIYNLMVRSGIVYHLTPIVIPVFDWWLLTFNKADLVKDDSGCTLRMKIWNNRRLPAFWLHRLNTVKDVKIRKEDFLLCGYQKTGCHWVYEILQMILNKRVTFSKYGKISEGMFDLMPDIMIDSVPSPRVLNSHLLYHELPKGILENKTKIILTIRCPKDTMVSFYNHTINLYAFYKYTGCFDDYFKMFVRGELDYGSYFGYYQSWDKIVRNQKDNEIYFLAYEDLKENTVSKIMELAQFVGEEITEDFAKNIANATEFSKQKKKRGNDPLIRKGIVGDWRNWMSDEQAKEMDNVWRESMTSLKLPSRAESYGC